MDGFESAMLKQRSKQESLDVQTIKKNPKLLTMLKIEKHASKVYTHSAFAIVQKEILEGLYSCSLDRMDKEEDTEIYVVKEKREKKNEGTNEEKTKEGSNEEKQNEGANKEKQSFNYKVLRNGQDESITCTCRHYLRFGILCRHCFWVLKNNNIDEIPEKYIMRRWRRDIIPPELRSRRNRYGNENIVVQNSVNEITSVVDDCLELIGPDEKMLQEFLEKIKLMKIEVEAQVPKQSKKKDDVMAKMVGVSKPDFVDIQNPPVGKYKGCANDKRLMSGKEKGIKESRKRKMSCSGCGSTEHNVRTCPKKKQAKEQAKEQDTKEQEAKEQHDTTNN